MGANKEIHQITRADWRGTGFCLGNLTMSWHRIHFSVPSTPPDFSINNNTNDNLSPEITDWSQSLMLHFTLIVPSQTWKTFQQKYQIFRSVKISIQNIASLPLTTSL
jgi:hypothetical protein